MITFILSFIAVFIPVFLILYVLSSWLRYRLYKYIGSRMSWTAWVPFCSVPWFGMIDAVYDENELEWLRYDVIRIIEIICITSWFVSFTLVIGKLFTLVFYVTWIVLFVLYLYCILKLCESIEYEPLIVILISFIQIIGGMIANVILYNQAVKSEHYS